MLDAGALSVLRAAPQGTLRLTHVSGPVAGLVIPLEIGSIEQRDALKTWTIYVDGVLQAGVRLGVTADGYLHLMARGTLLRIH